MQMVLILKKRKQKFVNQGNKTEYSRFRFVICKKIRKQSKVVETKA